MRCEKGDVDEGEKLREERILLSYTHFKKIKNFEKNTDILWSIRSNIENVVF